MSFKREVFQKVGLFDPRFGFSRNSQMQAEEPELALRLERKMGKNVIYNPEAVVYHRVPPEKTRWPGLLKRCFYQGYSKAILSRYYPGGRATASERKYLRYLLSRSIPGRASRFYRLAELQKLALLSTSIISVGLGFGYGRLTGRTIRNKLWKTKTET
jgi:GT2 family glycosyltransferase